MKKTCIQIVSLVILVAMLVSCETLALEDNASSTGTSGYSAKQKESPEAKFLGTWVYSDKNYGQAANLRGEDLPTDLSVEYAFSFRPDATGTFFTNFHSNDIEHEEQQEFLWSLDPIASSWVIVVMRDNTAQNFSMHYVSPLFLSMNDVDLGKIFFAKKPQGAVEQ